MAVKYLRAVVGLITLAALLAGAYNAYEVVRYILRLRGGDVAFYTSTMTAVVVSALVIALVLLIYEGYTKRMRALPH